MTSGRAGLGGDGGQARGLATVTGACAVLGGAAWVTACVIHASQPSGCVGDTDCARVSMREATSATSLLLAVTGALLVASGAGLLTMIRRRDRLGRATVTGAVLCVLGVGVLAVAVTVQAVFFDDDFSYMPFLVVPGVALLCVGLALVAWTVMRSGLLPRWVGAALLGGAVLLPAANEQTDAVLLAVPFGLAWMATGVAVWGAHSRTPVPGPSTHVT